MPPVAARCDKKIHTGNFALNGEKIMTIVENLITTHARRAAMWKRRPLVFFDIEHTGGARETRAITELAAIVVHPDGKVTTFELLVKPWEGAVFNPFAMRITRIGPKTVANAPSWERGCAEFVMDHQHAVWVGFNSRATDAPIIREEFERLGLPAPMFQHQMDLMVEMRTRGHNGGLGAMVEQFAPQAVETDAHRAMADVRMTLALFEAMHAMDVGDTPTVAKAPVTKVATATKAPKEIPEKEKSKAKERPEKKRAEKSASVTVRVPSWVPGDPSSGPRNGQKWSEEERAAMLSFFKDATTCREDTVAQLASRHLRSAFAVACQLKTAGLMTEDEALLFKAPLAA